MNQSPAPAVNPKPARVRVAGHFGELAQGLAARGGPVALVTLPCPALVTEVAFTPAPGPLVSSEPVSRKALAAARAALGLIGRGAWGGEIAIRRACPPGLGAGTSTAETLGAVRAVAAAFGVRLDPDAEAMLCLGAEGAVDPLMHPGPVLFASREARILRHLPPLPPMAVIGGFAGAPRETDPADGGFAVLEAEFAEIARALSAHDLAWLGRLATRSAEAVQARNPNPAWSAMHRIAAEVGALGIAVAHTGAAIALLMPAHTNLAAARAGLAQVGVRGIVGWRL